MNRISIISGKEPLAIDSVTFDFHNDDKIQICLRFGKQECHIELDKRTAEKVNELLTLVL